MALHLATRALRVPASRSAVRLMATKPPRAPSSSSSSKPVSSPIPKEDPTAPSRSALPSLDFDPASSAISGPASGERTGARSAEGSLSSIERKRRFLSRFGLGVLALGVGAYYVYTGREWEESEAILKRDSLLAGYSDDRIGRANARIFDLFDYFNKPISNELLPQPPLRGHTLVLSLDDLLVTSTWDREHGWRTAKRPGLDYFLGYLSLFYEIVIYTSLPQYTAIPICDSLDPYGRHIYQALTRESTRYRSGKIVKDLACLNRDLSKVILLDTHPDHASAQPENSIVLPPWKGDPRDKGLIAMIPFLESIALLDLADVRPVLKAYEGKDIPSTYAAIEAEHKRRVVEQWEKKRGGNRLPAASGVGRFTAGSLFRGATAPDPSQPPLTLLEQGRKRAQEIYKEEQEYFLKLLPDLEKEKEILKEKERQPSGTLLGVFTGANFRPPEEQTALPTPGQVPPPPSVSTTPAR